MAVAVVVLASSFAFATRTLQDETGRTVRVPDQIRRIVCLSPNLTETVYAIGGGEQVVGVTDYTFFPPEARQKPSVGDLLKPSLERIVSLRPDVVIAVSTFNNPDVIRALERAGVPVFLVQVRGLAGLYSSISNIGHLLARDAQAAALVASLRAREKKVRAEAQGHTPLPVFLALSMDPCITAGKGAFLTEMIAIAGGRSVTADLAQDWVRVDLEAIIPRRPAYVVVMDDVPFGLKEMQERAGWNALDAVRAAHVMRLDVRLQVPSPVAFDALEVLARQIREAQATEQKRAGR